MAAVGHNGPDPRPPVAAKGSLVHVSVLFDSLPTGAVELLGTALVLGFRHGFDWDHLAAITDVTSTTTTADVAETGHERAHERAPEHAHVHGGSAELAAHTASPPRPHPREATAEMSPGGEERRALLLGSLYALGHATVVVALGLLALSFGAVLPDWVDPIMARIVGLTLLLLGIWVFISLYQYARHGLPFRIRSRWMLVFDGIRYGWRRFQSRLHGHEHVDPIEMSSYGPRTAFGVGMIHGVGAETGSQVLLIAAIGGASASGLGVPMLVAFVVGLLISNSLVVLITATGFIATRARERVYLAIGLIAGTFSLVVGSIFLFGLQSGLPELDRLFGG
jgi:cytochrome c biogenesis protein CcdA